MSAYEETVPVVTLDDALHDYGIERVDLLKLDLEGAELAALRGAARSLKSGVIRVVAFEFGCPSIYSRVFFHDLWGLLAGYGFHLARVVPGGQLLEIRETAENLSTSAGVSNYVATQEG